MAAPRRKERGGASPDTVEPIAEEEEAAAEEVDALGGGEAATREGLAAIAKEQEAKATKEQEDEKRRQRDSRSPATSDNAPYPVGARVNLKAQIGADQLAYVVEYDQMNAVYDGGRRAEPADQPIVSADAVKPATSAYAKGTQGSASSDPLRCVRRLRLGLRERSLHEVALGHPDSENAKMVRAGADLRPATSGYPDGERVLVTRSSGLETTACVVAFRFCNSCLYKLALGSPESEEIKVAREKDIRRRRRANRFCQGPIQRSPPQRIYWRPATARRSGGGAAKAARLQMATLSRRRCRRSATSGDTPCRRRPGADGGTHNSGGRRGGARGGQARANPAKPAIMVKKASLGDVYGRHPNVETHREAAETAAAAPAATEAVATDTRGRGDR